jgi:hypothetical protein
MPIDANFLLKYRHDFRGIFLLCKVGGGFVHFSGSSRKHYLNKAVKLLGSCVWKHMTSFVKGCFNSNL